MSSLNQRFAAICVLIFSVLTALILPGCGGSSAGTPTTNFSLTKTPVQAQIQVPTGSPITDPTALTPWSSGGATEPNSSGQTNITIFNNGPQYSDVRDNQGRLVLVSFLSPDNKVLNAETTAEALIFFAIGGAAQIDKGPETILAGIRDLTGYGSVVDEVSAQLTAQGYISLEAGSLKDKIQDIVDSFGTPAPDGRGTIAEPTNASGLFLNTIIDGQFTIQNNHLRRARGWLRQVSYVGADGKEYESKTDYKKFDIAAPSRYGGFSGTVVGIAKGELTWTPTVSENYSIPLAPTDALSTTYELKTFGLGLSPGNLETLTPEEQSELIEISLKSVFLDAILPVVANIILPLKSGGIEEFVKFANGSAIVSDLINIARETLPQVYDKLEAGELKNAINLLWDSGFTTNSMLPALLQVAIDFGEAYGSDAFFDNSGNLAEALNKRLALLGLVDVFFSATDMAIFTNDFAKSDRSNIFTIKTTGGKASLTADDPIVSVFDTTVIHAVIQNKNPDAVYKYEWSVSEGYKLSTSNGNTSTAPNGILASNDDFAVISTLTDEPGTATISCKVTRIDGEPDQPIDQPTLQYRFVPAPTASPNPAEVDLNDEVTIAMDYDGTETPSYKFSINTTQFGSIDHTNISENPNVIFSANDNQGTVTLTIDCFLTINGTQVKFHSKTMPINIGVDYDRTPELSYDSWVYQQTSNWRAEVFAYLTLPRVPNATRYELSVDGKVIASWNDGETIPKNSPYPSVIGSFEPFALSKGLDLTTHIGIAFNVSQGQTQGAALAGLPTVTGYLRDFLAPRVWEFEAFFD